VLRGLHGEAMTKLVGVAYGSALGAYLDTREASATYGAVQTVELVPGVQVLVPAGVCNGFQTTSELSVYVYGFDAEWAPGMPGTAVHPLSVGIDWPLEPVLSEKDASLPGWGS
jgi:dTDP-4-dehydrorhamnose 3,5-epimerase